MSYCKNIKTSFLISIMRCWGLHLENIKDDFVNIWIFLHPQIPDFQIVVSQPKKNNKKAYLFSFQMMYKSKFWKMYPLLL